MQAENAGATQRAILIKYICCSLTSHFITCSQIGLGLLWEFVSRSHCRCRNHKLVIWLTTTACFSFSSRLQYLHHGVCVLFYSWCWNFWGFAINLRVYKLYIILAQTYANLTVYLWIMMLILVWIGSTLPICTDWYDCLCIYYLHLVEYVHCTCIPIERFDVLFNYKYWRLFTAGYSLKFAL